MSEYTEATRFIDLERQQLRIRERITSAIESVLDHGQYIMGPEVKMLEDELEAFSGSKYALTCANGTDALSLVLMAWNLSAADAVFVPSFTYVASAEAPAQIGATPFFVDVDPLTFNLDPNSLRQAIVDAKKLNLNPRVVIVVDLFGQPGITPELEEIANEEKIKILIDGAQSFGASVGGKRTGSLGHATTTSFFPAKPLGCYGDGGCIFVQDEEEATKINSLRLHGKGNQKYDNVRVGLNSRLDTMQAAILLEKLKIFEEEVDLRQKVAGTYAELLPESVVTPIVGEGLVSAWAQYTIKVQSRDYLKQYLQEKKIPTVVYYPKAVSQQSGYTRFPRVSSGLEVSETLPNQVLSLPMHPYLTLSEQEVIAGAIEECLRV